MGYESICFSDQPCHLLSELCTKILLDPDFCKNYLKSQALEERLRIYITKVESCEHRLAQDPEQKNFIAQLTLGLVNEILLRLNFTDGLAFDLLKAWQSYEDIIYLTRSTYRDHFMHQFYVFLLGCIFLERIYRKNTKRKLSRERLLRRWFLASMFHDIGYPAETLSDLEKTLNKNFFKKIPNYSIKKIQLSQFDNDPSIDNLVEAISVIHLLDEYIDYSHIFKNYFMIKGGAKLNSEESMYAKSLQELKSLFLGEVLQTHDHGVTGAIFFLKTALIDLREMKLKKKEHAMLVEDLFVAAAAIAGHNFRSKAYPGYTVDFGKRPISALLNLCDDIQEWDRAPSDYNWESRGWRLKKITDGITHDEFQIKFEYSRQSDEEGNNIRQQANFLRSLDRLFELNLSDADSIFYECITISGFACGMSFSAKRYDGKNSGNDYHHGRYEIGRKDHQDKHITQCPRVGTQECMHCGYPDAHRWSLTATDDDC